MTEPTRDDYIRNLKTQLALGRKQPDFAMMHDPDMVLPFLKGQIGLKWKETFFLFIREGDCMVEFAAFCELLKREWPGIGMINLEELHTGMLHPGPIDEEGFAQINMKDYVMNRPFPIKIRITRIVNPNKGAF